jgi:hypothetical protein
MSIFSICLPLGCQIKCQAAITVQNGKIGRSPDRLAAVSPFAALSPFHPSGCTRRVKGGLPCIARRRKAKFTQSPVGYNPTGEEKAGEEKNRSAARILGWISLPLQPIIFI